MKSTKTCSIDGCDRPLDGRGWCKMHWKRWKRNGDPEALQPTLYATATCSVEGCDEPFQARDLCKKHYARWLRWGSADVTKHAPWGAGSLTRGYRIFQANHEKTLEHRRVMEGIVGRPLLPEERVHHKDRNRSNNSPENLVLCANDAEHMKIHARERTHCINGHLRTTEDTWTNPRGHIQCKICNRKKSREAQARRSKRLKDQRSTL